MPQPGGGGADTLEEKLVVAVDRHGLSVKCDDAARIAELAHRQERRGV